MKRLMGAALLLLSATASAVTVQLDQPGYFAIDGRYYVLGLPHQGDLTGPAELRSLGTEGFYLVAFLSANVCQGGVPAEGAPLGGLRHAELPALPDAPQFALGVDAAGQSSVSIVQCDGVTVLLAESSLHDVQCSGAIAFPFKRGQCPGLDAADSGHVFFDAFESAATAQ